MSDGQKTSVSLVHARGGTLNAGERLKTKCEIEFKESRVRGCGAGLSRYGRHVWVRSTYGYERASTVEPEFYLR